AAVARGTYALLVCHDCFSLLAVAGTVDSGDLDFGVVLAMPLPLHVVLAAAELDDAHLVGAAVADDLRGDARALERVADLDAVAVAEHQDVVEGDLAAGLGLELLDAERLALRHAVLLPAGDQYCVHVEPLGSVVILVAWPPSRADRSGIIGVSATCAQAAPPHARGRAGTGRPPCARAGRRSGRTGAR